MTPAPCAVEDGFHSVTVCKDLASCVQTAEDSDKRQGVALAYESKGFRMFSEDDHRVIRLKLSEPLTGKPAAKVAPGNKECGTAISCFFLIKAEQELDWHARRMKTDCSVEAIASEFHVIYADEFKHPDGYVVVRGAALFNQKGELVGMSYDQEMIFHMFEKESFRCALADYAVTAATRWREL